MKINVVIKHTQTAKIDIGDLPANLVRDLLIKNEGTFNGEWTLGDIRQGNEAWTVDSVEITEASGK